MGNSIDTEMGTGSELIGGGGPIRAMGSGENGKVDSVYTLVQETAGEKKIRHKATMGQAAAAYSEFQTLQKSKDWKHVDYSVKGIEASEFPVRYLGDSEEDPIYTVKATGVVNGHSADLLAAKHSDNNRITRLSWDNELSDIGDLELISDNEDLGISLRVQYVEVKLPMVTTREFVNLQWSHCKKSKLSHSDHEWVLISSHTDHPNRPITNDKVRALSFSAMHLEPMTPEHVDGSLMEIPSTNVTIIAWVRPGGMIPASIIKLKKTALADRIAFLRKTQFV